MTPIEDCCRTCTTCGATVCIDNDPDIATTGECTGHADGGS